jgi:hypothetical protein
MECPVCCEEWATETRVPRVLPCGHSICRPCIRAIFRSDVSAAACPECRLPLLCAIDTCPTNFALLRLVAAWHERGRDEVTRATCAPAPPPSPSLATPEPDAISKRERRRIVALLRRRLKDDPGLEVIEDDEPEEVDQRLYFCKVASYGPNGDRLDDATIVICPPLNVAVRLKARMRNAWLRFSDELGAPVAEEEEVSDGFEQRCEFGVMYAHRHGRGWRNFYRLDE